MNGYTSIHLKTRKLETTKYKHRYDEYDGYDDEYDYRGEWRNHIYKSTDEKLKRELEEYKATLPLYAWP